MAALQMTEPRAAIPHLGCGKVLPRNVQLLDR
jgi:hypothetical protein